MSKVRYFIGAGLGGRTASSMDFENKKEAEEACEKLNKLCKEIEMGLVFKVFEY